ncbi:MAG: hypothetical protein JST54_25900 [Deltaproteobacteria bacterium]|nr:hypothetical protein [Deltaproteobacteria bacterium]
MAMLGLAEGSGVTQALAGVLAAVMTVLGYAVWSDPFPSVLTAPNAQRAIERLEMPESSALMVNDAAVLFALYGDFDAARRELDRVNWVERHPFERVAEVSTRALIELVSGGDVGRARNFIRRAEQLAIQSEANHALRDRTQIVTLKSAAELFMEPANLAALELLRMCTSSKSARAQLFSQWALGVHFWREEEREQAAHHFAICKDLAPYCLVLHGPPERRVKPG